MLRSLVFTAGLAIVFFVAERTMSIPWLHTAWPYMLLFFLSLSYLLSRLMDIGNQRGSQGFVQFYLIFTVARLLLCAGFVGVFLYRGVDDRRVFVVDFLMLYILYTCFEIYDLSRNLRRDS